MDRTGDNGRGDFPYKGKHRLAFSAASFLLLTVGTSVPALAEFRITPSATAQVTATDNLRKQASNTEGDVALQTIGAISVSADSLRIKFLGTGSLMYDAFMENSDLNRLTGDALANTQVTVIPEFLFLDGSLQVSDEFLNVLDQSATGLPNGGPQNRVTNLQAGTYITTKLADIADVKLRGSISTVQSEALDGTLPTTALRDATSYEGSVMITNGSRSRNAVWRLSANILKEEFENDQEFESADASASLTVRVTPRIHAVVRGGYEEISGTTLVEISDVLWGAGFIYEIGQASRFSAEWGHRYGRDSWSGDLDVKISERIALNASYEERIESQQGRLSRQLGELFDQGNTLPPPQLPGQVTPGQSLVDDTFYVKDALLSLDYTGLSESFSLSGRFSEREFSALPGGDRTAGLTATYSEVLLRNLVLGLSGSYDATIDTTAANDGGRIVGSGQLSYVLGERASLNFQYTWSRTSAADDVTENVASAGITQSF